MAAGCFLVIDGDGALISDLSVAKWHAFAWTDSGLWASQILRESICVVSVQCLGPAGCLTS